MMLSSATVESRLRTDQSLWLMPVAHEALRPLALRLMPQLLSLGLNQCRQMMSQLVKEFNLRSVMVE